jgi:hypothetical protein
MKTIVALLSKSVARPVQARSRFLSVLLSALSPMSV